jgi:hypothetical protein
MKAEGKGDFFVSGGGINPIGHARAAWGYEVSFDK